MKIAVLGWGSLIWDKRELAIVGDWQAGGPVLPIEFSRISGDGRLTLVIDPQNGANVITLFTGSGFENLDDAIANLRDREGTSSDRIGYVNLTSNTERDYSRRQHPEACNVIKSWAQTNDWQAVIWTALPSNFTEKFLRSYTVGAAVAYVHKLPEDKRAKAFEYIQKAPEQIDTPFRREFQEIRKRHSRQSRKATAKEILGHAMTEEPLPDAPKLIVPNSWHGKRKIRRDAYQIPGQTAADLRLGLSDQGNVI